MQLRAALGIALAIGAMWFPSHADEDRPNVLFIAIDDLNDWTGVLGGHPQARTPNIDRLAERGVLFTQAYCPAPICIPSRTAVLTGIPPHVSGVIQNSGRFRRRKDGVVSLPELFRKNGYRSLGAGKVFHFPDPESWDTVFPADWIANRDPKSTDTGNDIPSLHWGALDVEDNEMFDVRVVNWAVDQVGREHERPFFFACGFSKPHLPWSVPRRYFERFPLEDVLLPDVIDDDLDDLTGIARAMAASPTHTKLLDEGKWKAAVQAYLASVSFMDEQVGVLLDALDRGPNAANTIVILWSDHGFHLGEKRHWKKWGLWEDSTRVPLIFAGAGIQTGVRNPHSVGTIDLFRTIAELCGLDVPAAVQGYSLVPLLENPDAKRPAPVLTTIGYEHTVRSDRWRYTRYRDGSEELYDHSRDPNEWVNLAGVEAHASVKSELGTWIPAPRQRRNERRPTPPK